MIKEDMNKFGISLILDESQEFKDKIELLNSTLNESSPELVVYIKLEPVVEFIDENFQQLTFYCSPVDPRSKSEIISIAESILSNYLYKKAV